MLFSPTDVTQMQRNFNCSLLELEIVKKFFLNAAGKNPREI
jgi:hypothetical protein